MKFIIKITLIILALAFIGVIFFNKVLLVNKVEILLDNYAKNTGIVLREVWVKGRHNQNRNEIIDALNIDIGDSVLFLNLDALKVKVDNLTWVANSSVFLLPHGKLEIEIEEHIPVAVYESNNTYYLIDQFGKKIIKIEVNDFSSLIRITGENALKNMKEMKEIVWELKNYELSLKKIERVSKRRWNIHFSEGFYAKLPPKEPTLSLSRLENFLSKYDIKSEKLAFIDLRLLDRVSLKYKD